MYAAYRTSLCIIYIKQNNGDVPRVAETSMTTYLLASSHTLMLVSLTRMCLSAIIADQHVHHWATMASAGRDLSSNLLSTIHIQPGSFAAARGLQILCDLRLRINCLPRLKTRCNMSPVLVGDRAAAGIFETINSQVCPTRLLWGYSNCATCASKMRIVLLAIVTSAVACVLQKYSRKPVAKRLASVFKCVGRTPRERKYVCTRT